MNSQVFHSVWEEILPVSVPVRAPLTPRCVLKTWFEWIRAAERITQFIPGRNNQLAWLEFQNKLRAYYFFEHAGSVLGLQQEKIDIHEALSRLSLLEEADSVWAAEGVGRHFADSSRRDGGSPRNLLAGTFTGPVRKYLLPLHTGMGLSFAEAALGSVGHSGGGIVTGLNQFFELSRANSQEGFAGAACETLGLAARTLHPHLLPDIDGFLEKTDPEMLGYFWHGVGRALYFLPTGFFPGDGLIWQAVQKAQHEPPHDVGRRNATAGMAWALTLVNLRQPKIIKEFLKKYGNRLPLGDAFTNGVQSALIVWNFCAGQGPFLRLLCGHSPEPSESEDTGFWHEYILESCRFAEENYSFLAAAGHLGELFSYRALPEWISGLHSISAAGSPYRCHNEDGSGMPQEHLK
jgi:hypothetical protein